MVDNSLAIAEVKIVRHATGPGGVMTGRPHAVHVRGQNAAVVLEGHELGTHDRGLQLGAMVVGRVPISVRRVKATSPDRELVADDVADLQAFDIDDGLAVGFAGVVPVVEFDHILHQGTNVIGKVRCNVEIEIAELEAAISRRAVLLAGGGVVGIGEAVNRQTFDVCGGRCGYCQGGQY